MHEFSEKRALFVVTLFCLFARYIGVKDMAVFALFFSAVYSADGFHSSAFKKFRKRPRFCEKKIICRGHHERRRKRGRNIFPDVELFAVSFFVFTEVIVHELYGFQFVKIAIHTAVERCGFYFYLCHIETEQFRIIGRSKERTVLACDLRARRIPRHEKIS